MMKASNTKSLPKKLILACGAMLLAMTSQGVLAADFAKVDYRGNAVFWDLSLPKDATGATMSVVYTPTDPREDSWLEEVTVEGGRVVYPFSTKLQDGTYTWELRLLREGPVLKGFSAGTKAAEGAIDQNGRQIAIVGETIPTKGRIRLSNSGRDSTQSGSFSVVRGSIPELNTQEKEEEK